MRKRIGNTAGRLEGRENKIRVLRVRRLAAPLPQMMRQDRMEWDVAVRCFRLVPPSLPFAQRFETGTRSSSQRMWAQRIARIYDERSAVAALMSTSV
jgi:hypothetical protein